jgi:hypothetical protein
MAEENAEADPNATESEEEGDLGQLADQMNNPALQALQAQQQAQQLFQAQLAHAPELNQFANTLAQERANMAVAVNQYNLGNELPMNQIYGNLNFIRNILRQHFNAGFYLDLERAIFLDQLYTEFLDHIEYEVFMG